MRDRVPQIKFEPAREDGWPSIALTHEDDTRAVRCPVGENEMLILRDLEDVQGCLMNTEFGFTGMPEEHVLTGAEVQHADGLLRLDSPRLNEFRAAINRFFSARYSEQGRPVAKHTAEQLVSQLMTSHNVVDLSRAYLEPFIAHSVCSTLGVDTKDWPLLFRSAQASLAIAECQEDVDASKIAWNDLYSYYAQILHDKRSQPDDALLSRAIGSLTERGFSDDEIVRTCASISNGFPAVLPVMDVAIIELLRRPEVVQECLQDPSCWKEVVNEVMRYKAHFSIVLPRITNRDTMLNDRLIPAGTVVLPSLTGAAHDPRHTEYPNEFVRGQNAPNNIVFGAGTHFCPGAALTRQWLEVGFEAFFKSFPNAKLAVSPSELEWQGGSLPAPKGVPVRLDS